MEIRSPGHMVVFLTIGVFVFSTMTYHTRLDAQCPVKRCIADSCQVRYKAGTSTSDPPVRVCILYKDDHGNCTHQPGTNVNDARFTSTLTGMTQLKEVPTCSADTTCNSEYQAQTLGYYKATGCDGEGINWSDEFRRIQCCSIPNETCKGGQKVKTEQCKDVEAT